MLKSLLKYDLKSINKILIVFYILAVIFALITRLFFSIDGSTIINIIGQFCSGVTISMIINIVINNLMRVWVRFKNNFYGDESYLTHTLPVSKTNLYLSKFLTSVITMFISVFVIALTIFIAYYSKENFELLKLFIEPLTSITNGSAIKLIVVIIFVYFLEMLVGLLSGYNGIILGNMRNNKKTAFSVIYGFITYILSQVVVVVFMFIVGLFNEDILKVFTTEVISSEILKQFMYIGLVAYLLIVVVLYFINLKLFKNGVNVE